MGPSKDDLKLVNKMYDKKGNKSDFGKKAAEYEKNMDPKKRQELKDKATKGMKFTQEGMSYGLYKGSGKPGGAMKDYLDKKAKMLTKKRNKQSDAAKNNPHFDSTQPSPSGRNKYEEYVSERRGSDTETLTNNRESFVSKVKNKLKNVKDKIKKDGLIKFTDAKKRREELGNKDYSIDKLSPKINLGLSKDVDITKDGPGKVVKQVTKDKVVKPIVNKGKEIVGNVASKATSGIKDAIKDAGKVVGSNVGKGLIGGAAILGTAALASKALERRKEKKEKEKVKSEQMTFQQFQEKCWDGYEKKGMKTMFGKRYPNCVKKKK